MGNLKHLFLAGMAAMAFIFINGWIRCRYFGGHDIFMKKLGVADLDGWSILHFVFFAVLGQWFPDMIGPAMAMGVAWELFEAYLGEARPSWMGGFGDCALTTDQLDTTHRGWWYGRVSDLVVNLAGFLLGRAW